MAFLEVIQVVPTAVAEGVGRQRCAEQISHLAASHADFDLFYRRLVKEISLLNIDTVDAAR
jgi:hypothetical protein